MPTIRLVPFLIPRSTSQLICAPPYERPLIQAKYNISPDRSQWVRELQTWPAEIASLAKTVEADLESEMLRLTVHYGVAAFRKVYPTDASFKEAFEASFAIPTTFEEPKPEAIPNLEKTQDVLIDEFLELQVPAMTRDRAELLLRAGYTVDQLANVDVKAVASITNLPLNFVKAVVDAVKLKLQRETEQASVSRRKASTVTMQPSAVEAPGL